MARDEVYAPKIDGGLLGNWIKFVDQYNPKSRNTQNTVLVLAQKVTDSKIIFPEVMYG